MQLKLFAFAHSDAPTQSSIPNGFAIMSQLPFGKLRRLTSCYMSAFGLIDFGGTYVM